MKFVTSLAIIFSIASCKPKAGATCKLPGDRACAGDTTELVCQSGAWAAFPCNNGCKKQGDGVFCDVGLANENDPCPKEDEKRKTCSVDHKSRLTCTDGKYVARKCVGMGCALDDDGKVTCDIGEPELGTPCDPGKDRATCGLDRKSQIRCGSDHRWAVERVCRGPSGCQRLSVNESQTCDITFADVGDACRIDEESRVTCSSDQKAKLGCSGGKWKVEATCAKPCSSDDATVTCDPMTGCVMVPSGASCGK